MGQQQAKIGQKQTEIAKHREREKVKHRDCYMVRYRDRVRDSKTHTYVYVYKKRDVVRQIVQRGSETQKETD